MKRLLMIDPSTCGSSDTTEGKVYEVTNDILYYHYEGKENEDDIDEEYDFDSALWEEHPEYERCVTIKDNSSEDSFEVYKDDERCVVCYNDKELAIELINRISGLDKALTNMYLLMNCN